MLRRLDGINHVRPFVNAALSVFSAKSPRGANVSVGDEIILRRETGGPRIRVKSSLLPTWMMNTAISTGREELRNQEIDTASKNSRVKNLRSSRKSRRRSRSSEKSRRGSRSSRREDSRERRGSRRSRSRSGSGSDHGRGRSRSRSQDRSAAPKSVTDAGLAPSSTTAPAAAAAAPAAGLNPAQIALAAARNLGVPSALPGQAAGGLSGLGAAGAGGFQANPQLLAQVMRSAQQQAGTPGQFSLPLGSAAGAVPGMLGGMGMGMGDKTVRELFVGNTPQGTSDFVLLEFLNAAMKQKGKGGLLRKRICGGKGNGWR
ncbi:unnamed protein product [Ectocarpus sp. 13 AM-2016]